MTYLLISCSSFDLYFQSDIILLSRLPSPVHNLIALEVFATSMGVYLGAGVQEYAC